MPIGRFRSAISAAAATVRFGQGNLAPIQRQVYRSTGRRTRDRGGQPTASSCRSCIPEIGRLGG